MFPEFELPAELIDETEEQLEEVVGYAYDYDEEQTVVTGTGKTKLTGARDAYIYWCVKCVATERYKYEAYSTDYGIEFERLIRSDYSRPVIESELERSIKEALKVDNRTVDVFNFRFRWEQDSCYINFEVRSVYGVDSISVVRGGVASGRL